MGKELREDNHLDFFFRKKKKNLTALIPQDSQLSIAQSSSSCFSSYTSRFLVICTLYFQNYFPFQFSHHIGFLGISKFTVNL